MTTALQEDELLTEVRLPLLTADTRFGFCEFNRRAGDFAIAMALVTFQVKNSAISEPRIAIGGAEATPRRIAQAESVLNGRAPDGKIFSAAADVAAKAADPLEDENTSVDYRRGLVRTVVLRALERAAA
jgi:aerobic carbon-monoxide dehydrogenase medium subunit